MQPIRVAHVILVHKNPEQANTFIRQLVATGNADAFIHIDAKCPDSLSKAILTGPSVHIVPTRVSVGWADFSMIEATLAALRAVRDSGIQYDFVTVNSGQDLLVRDGLHAHLAANPDTTFMQATRFPSAAPGNYVWRIQWPASARGSSSPWHWSRFLRIAFRLLYARGLNPRPNPHLLPAGWDYFSGSQWICMSRPAFHYALDYLDRNPSFCEIFRHSVVPDMAFFQTLIMNSPHAAQVSGQNLTFLNFGKSFRTCNSPVTLTMADVSAIESSGRFFARKFEQSEDSAVIDYFSRKYASR